MNEDHALEESFRSPRLSKTVQLFNAKIAKAEKKVHHNYSKT